MEGLVFRDVIVEYIEILGKGADFDFIGYNVVELILHKREEQNISTCQRCSVLLRQFLQPFIQHLLCSALVSFFRQACANRSLMPLTILI